MIRAQIPIPKCLAEIKSSQTATLTGSTPAPRAFRAETGQDQCPLIMFGSVISGGRFSISRSRTAVAIISPSANRERFRIVEGQVFG